MKTGQLFIISILWRISTELLIHRAHGRQIHPVQIQSGSFEEQDSLKLNEKLFLLFTGPEMFDQCVFNVKLCLCQQVTGGSLYTDLLKVRMESIKLFIHSALVVQERTCFKN